MDPVAMPDRTHDDEGAPQYDDERCVRCGRCCHEKLVVDDMVLFTSKPCVYLDEQTKLCTVYEQRHVVNPKCLSVEAGIKFSVFPRDCPYVADLPDYKPPVEGDIGDEVMRQIESGEVRGGREVRRLVAQIVGGRESDEG